MNKQKERVPLIPVQTLDNAIELGLVKLGDTVQVKCCSGDLSAPVEAFRNFPKCVLSEALMDRIREIETDSWEGHKGGDSALVVETHENASLVVHVLDFMRLGKDWIAPKDESQLPHLVRVSDSLSVPDMQHYLKPIEVLPFHKAHPYLMLRVVGERIVFPKFAKSFICGPVEREDIGYQYHTCTLAIDVESLHKLIGLLCTVYNLVSVTETNGNMGYHFQSRS